MTTAPTGKANGEFFVGYGKPPPGVARYVLKVAAAALVFVFLLSFALAWSIQERGGGGFAPALKVQGRVANVPYPVLQIFPSPQYPAGRVMLIAGGGKQGMAKVVGSLQGKALEVSGGHLKRGDLDVIITDTPQHFRTIAETANIPEHRLQPLGTWTIAGEICDGKCYAGIMRPGQGISHKACANLCIIGDQPAVFATVRPVFGASFLLLSAKDGKLPPSIMYDYVGQPVELRGELLRYGDLKIFRADWSAVRRQ